MGVPKLVARSTNMKYLDKDGKEVEGTFMDFAEGLDLRGKNGEKLCGQVREEQPFGPPYGINKDLADMQVLDYICGNVDRHAGNLTYRVNDEGMITGLQGIDNDSSFGVVRPHKENGLIQLPGLNKFMVISQSMAETLEGMTPEMLKFALRGRGLTEPEIYAACDSLKDVRKLAKEAAVCSKSEDVTANISAGRPVVLTDDLLKGIEPETFAVKSEKYVGNLFRKAVLATRQVLKSARKKGIKYDPDSKKEKCKPDRTGSELRELMEKADESMKKLRETTQAYLNKKMREKGVSSLDALVPKNAYEARRIKLARDVMENIVDYDSRSASFTRMELQEKRQQKKAPEKTEERTVSL